jgi:hypothetical protein
LKELSAGIQKIWRQQERFWKIALNIISNLKKFRYHLPLIPLMFKGNDFSQGVERFFCREN